MSSNYTSSVLLPQQCHSPAHDPRVMRVYTSQHPCRSGTTSFCLIGAVKYLLCKTGVQMLQAALPRHQRISNEGFRMDSLCRVPAGERALLSHTDEGRKAEPKVRTLRHRGKTRTSSKEEGCCLWGFTETWRWPTDWIMLNHSVG